MIHPSVQVFLPEILELLKKSKVESAFLFGSVLTNSFGPESDIDFIINFKEQLDPMEKGELYWNLYDNLKNKLDREVDIISEKSLKNPYFIKEINHSKYKIYG
ncbi:nucleotidyltransferase domain-containing protein [Lacihabitans sp. CCS-44]|uniref:nucleotidyltransferase family protein n=1 Tax=Lacihabitans sp. CCS-44 TaxID=2487331 RepID=UPI0020CF3CE8|nr:nucleotidyltransferase domain-containing protein [Lacihabitans sp. CCS-44]MCP9757513.1 nucleotidyltransferase domain-containing protein [Lacihabitans sp. CCS-44]